MLRCLSSSPRRVRTHQSPQTFPTALQRASCGSLAWLKPPTTMRLRGMPAATSSAISPPTCSTASAVPCGSNGLPAGAADGGQGGPWGSRAVVGASSAELRRDPARAPLPLPLLEAQVGGGRAAREPHPSSCLAGLPGLSGKCQTSCSRASGGGASGGGVSDDPRSQKGACSALGSGASGGAATLPKAG